MYRIAVVACLLCACFASAPAGAQVVTGSTGALNGTVADDSKSVLPGATVSIVSAAMIGGARETVTDSQGRYQFAAIPPGDYTVTFTLAGFATVIREGIIVRLGFTATVNAELPVATQQETITVTGASPVVDTTATNISNNFDSEAIANLPTARDSTALMAETPGVAMTRIDVGGSAAMNETGYTVYGLSSGGDTLSTEGVTSPNLSNLYNDFGAAEEVQITTAAHTAQMATAGVMTNVIFKAGGNAYRGTFYMDYETDQWAAHNIDDKQIALGVKGGFGLDARDTNRVDQYKDINGDLGGFVLKDKLWWFGSLRYNASRVRFVNYPVQPQFTRIVSATTKWTYMLSQNNKLVGFYNNNMKYQPDRFVDKNQIHYTVNETWDEDFPVGNYKGEFNSVLSDSMFMETMVAQHFHRLTNYSNAPEKPLYIDTATQERFGGARLQDTDNTRPQANGSLSYFMRRWGNTHNLKFGWEVAQWRRTAYEKGRVSRETVDSPNPPADVEHRLVNGSPSEVLLYESPSTSQNFQWTYSAYANDSWQLSSHLSFNLGLRFDRYRNETPEQIHPAGLFNPTEVRFPANPNVFHFNNIGPRLGVVWDIRGNGKTVMKVNYGSYPWRPDTVVAGGNPNPPSWYKRYAWNDLNGDRLWQPGEQGQLVAQVGGVSNAVIDPNWTNNVTKELVTFLERELVTDFGVRTGIVWRGDEHKQVALNPNRPIEAYNVPITVRDPGPDGTLGNADDGPSFTAFNLAQSYINVPLVNMTTDNPYLEHGDDHYTWELSGVKRMSHRWSMNASFAHTWSRTAVNGTDPNAFLGTDDGQRKHYTNWQGKLAGTFQLGRDFKLSPMLRHQSGAPFGRTIQARLNYGTQTIQVEPQSTRRVANVSLADVRLEKGFSVAKKRVAVLFDLFNILNANPEQEIVQGSGSTFLRPVVIVGPRVARIGAKFDW